MRQGGRKIKINYTSSCNSIFFAYFFLLIPGNHQRFDLPGSSSSTSLSSMSRKPAWASVSSGLPNWKKSEEDTECTICYDSMNAFGDENPPYSLPCKHSYHTNVSTLRYLFSKIINTLKIITLTFDLIKRVTLIKFQCIKKWLTETSVCPICRIHCTMDTEFPPLP